jgi:hypothetical protein
MSLHPAVAVDGAAGDGELPDLPDGGEGLKEREKALFRQEGPVVGHAPLPRPSQSFPPVGLRLHPVPQGGLGEVEEELLQVAHGQIGVAVAVRQGLPLLREAEAAVHAPWGEAGDGPARRAAPPGGGGAPAVEEVDGKLPLLPHPA